MTLIDYHSTRGHKLFDPINRIIVISRDMVIYDLKEWDWINSTKKDSVRIMYEESNSEVEVQTQANTNRP